MAGGVNKVCARCSQPKADSEFYRKTRRGKRLLHSYCKPCFREYTKTRPLYLEKASEYGRNRYRERRTLVDQLKSVPCADCGGVFDPVCMDFDHRPGSGKTFDISRQMISRTIEALIAEIAKCDVVCANCHRLRTYRKRDHNEYKRAWKARKQQEGDKNNERA